MRKIFMIYARVSPHGSTNTSQETSIRAQMDECRRFVLQREPDAEFLEETDEFKSGKSINRPGIQRIISEIKGGNPRFSALVVWHLDRLSRSIADAAPLFELFREHGIGLICVRQGWDMTTASGRLMLYFFVLIAQYEREMCSDRTRTKMMSIARQGKVPYGKLPYGFKRDGENNLLPVKDEIENVREMVEEIAEGRFSYLDFKARHPDFPLSKSRCYGLLRNRIYIGVLEYGGTETPLPMGEAIPRELFEKAGRAAAANSRRAGNEYSPRSGGLRNYPLAGKVFCKCGMHMTPYSVVKGGKKSYHYYKCTAPECALAVSAPKLEDEVFSRIREMATDPELLAEAWKRFQRETGEDGGEDAAQLVRLEAKRDEIAKKEEAIVSAFADGLVSRENKARINASLKAITEERLSTEAEIAEARERLEKRKGADADFAAMCREFSTYASLDDGDPATRQALFELLVERVTLLGIGEGKSRRFRLDLCASPAGVAKNGEMGITFRIQTEFWVSPLRERNGRQRTPPPHISLCNRHLWSRM